MNAHMMRYLGQTVRTLVFAVVFLTIQGRAAGAVELTSGTIRGKVVDAANQEPLPGVNVVLDGSNVGASTDGRGEFTLGGLTPGSYTMTFRLVGYTPAAVTDVIVRPGRITYTNPELHEAVLSGDEVLVTSGYFQKDDVTPLSAVSFNAEETRRAPGSAGDVSRILNVLPSVAQVQDNSNDLMVRGGSPSENGFFVDNIQIPNINHFPVQGATGGPIGIINVDFLENVTFHTGGFSAAYGDRLSSIAELTFRDGDREAYDLQLDMNMAGFGGVVEGPFPDSVGSWFLSARRSYLDVISRMLGMPFAPRYGDAHAKATFDAGRADRITVLNIYGNSSVDMTQQDGKDHEAPIYGTYDTWQNSTGINWRHLLGEKGFSNTAVSYSFIKSRGLWSNTNTGLPQMGNNYLEGYLRLRNATFLQLNRFHRLEFGIDACREQADYNYFFSPVTNRLGNPAPGMAVDGRFPSTIAGAFISYSWNPWPELTTTWGVRADYYDRGRHLLVSPRFSASLQMNDRLSLNAATGIFYQQLPLFILSQESRYADLKAPKAVHYVIGMDYMLTADTKLTVEVYDKEYASLPLERSDPALSVIDEGRMGNFFRDYPGLVDAGRAYSRGVEALVQKKLAKDIYGLISGTYFRSRYRDLNGIWRDRMYDNKFIFSVIGGYKPNERWEFSARWTIAGGVPYTPYDLARSTAANSGIIDGTRINEARYPVYHSLNLRVDRRFNFERSSLVVYFNALNAYNRSNIANYYWNEVENRQATEYQWTFLPIFGFEWEL